MSHHCDHVEAVLTGEAPWPAGAQLDDLVAGCPACAALHEALGDVDALARALPPLELPAPVRSRIGDSLMQETRRSGRWRRRLPVAALAAAGALWAVLSPSPPPAGPMVERGAGSRLPQVALKVAVVGAQGAARHAHGAPVPAGATLYFRAALDQSADLTLLRVSGHGAEPVGRWRLSPGEHELSGTGGALGWQVEVGEGDAVWALVAGSPGAPPLAAPLPANAAALCATARAAGYGCDARLVEVQP